MTRAKKLYIILGSVLLAAIIVASIAIPVTLKNPTVKIPSPSFSEFDRLSDMSIKLVWNNISGADSYDVEFCYGNPNVDGILIKNGSTQNTSFSIERKKAVLSARVRAVINNKKGDFSEWIYYDIPAIVLTTPTVAISQVSMNVTWTDVKYNYYGTKKSVPNYIYYFVVNDEDMISPIEMSTDSTTVSMGETYVLLYLDSVYKVSGEYDWATIETIWEDVEFTVFVKAVNYGLLGNTKLTNEEYEFVYDVYGESEYGEASITITYELYKSLRG